jgi:hypothetical protein
MTHQSHGSYVRMPIDAAGQIGQLRHVLGLVEELAGRGAEAASDPPGEGERIMRAYAEALPIVQRRFDALAAETVRWSAGAVEALLAAGERRSRAAAARLADELGRAISDLAAVLRP